MFALHVSHNCGMSYSKEAEAESLDELRSYMAELDESMLRWYLTKDGEDYWEEACRIHKPFMAGANTASSRLMAGTGKSPTVANQSESDSPA